LSFYGDYDLFGRKKSKKQATAERLANSQAKGKAAEDWTAVSYSIKGYEVERTGRGSDFRVRRRDPFTGRVVESKLVEVKSGNAKLSDLQKQTKKRKSNYKVDRVDPPFY
jgi:hypothetical protein